MLQEPATLGGVFSSGKSFSSMIRHEPFIEILEKGRCGILSMMEGVPSSWVRGRVGYSCHQSTLVAMAWPYRDVHVGEVG
jgi:hypothetical protein